METYNGINFFVFFFIIVMEHAYLSSHLMISVDEDESVKCPLKVTCLLYF